MVFALALSVLLASGPVSEPIFGVACYGSPLVLAASYVPDTASRATTVVNIWAELLPSKEPGIDDPIAWIYKNANGDFYLQVNARHAAEIRRAFRSSVATKLLRGDEGDQSPDPLQIPLPASYDRYFAKVHAQRASCFQRDLPAGSF